MAQGQVVVRDIMLRSVTFSGGDKDNPKDKQYDISEDNGKLYSTVQEWWDKSLTPNGKANPNGSAKDVGDQEIPLAFVRGTHVLAHAVFFINRAQFPKEGLKVRGKGPLVVEGGKERFEFAEIAAEIGLDPDGNDVKPWHK